MTNTEKHYGREREAEIRANASNFESLSDFEKFILERGYKFKTEEALRAGYDRKWKASHGILITLEEFLEEAEKGATELAVDTYDALARLVEEKKLRPGEVFAYAYYHWCINNPEAVIAYKTDSEKWAVNNCGEAITEAEARVKVCEEWGFEASRVQIVGTPYYDSTDWQFIRFNCAGVAWLWYQESLVKVW